MKPSNFGTFGCALVAMGSIAAIAGVAAFLEISPVRSDIELEFFGIELNTPSGRLWWVLGSLDPKQVDESGLSRV